MDVIDNSTTIRELQLLECGAVEVINQEPWNICSKVRGFGNTLKLFLGKVRPCIPVNKNLNLFFFKISVMIISALAPQHKLLRDIIHSTESKSIEIIVSCDEKFSNLIA